MKTLYTFLKLTITTIMLTVTALSCKTNKGTAVIIHQYDEQHKAVTMEGTIHMYLIKDDKIVGEISDYKHPEDETEYIIFSFRPTTGIDLADHLTAKEYRRLYGIPKHVGEFCIIGDPSEPQNDFAEKYIGKKVRVTGRFFIGTKIELQPFYFGFNEIEILKK